MKAAYDMLVCTGMKILEVAEKCGYSDQHYFSYCFKKFYGESPNKVRNDNRTGRRMTYPRWERRNGVQVKGGGKNGA